MDAVGAEVLSTRGHDIPASFVHSRTFTIPSTMQRDGHSCYLRLGTVTREKSESVRGERRPPNVFWVTYGGIRGNERGHSLMLERVIRSCCWPQFCSLPPTLPWPGLGRGRIFFQFKCVPETKTDISFLGKWTQSRSLPGPVCSPGRSGAGEAGR